MAKSQSGFRLSLFAAALLMFITFSSCDKQVVDFVKGALPSTTVIAKLDFQKTEIIVSSSAPADGITPLVVTLKLKNSDDSAVINYIPKYSVTSSSEVFVSDCTHSDSHGFSSCIVKSTLAGLKSFQLTNAKVGLATDILFDVSLAPPCTNGDIYAMVPGLSGQLIVGGNFTQIGPCSGSGVPLKISDGSKINSFNRSTMSVVGIVSTSISDGAGGWYIGGSLTYVGSMGIQNLAHINSDGSLNTTFNANLDGSVNSLLLDGASLYVSGSFNFVGVTHRAYLAQVNATTGAVNPNFNPGISGPSNALAKSGNNLIAGGNFTNLNSSYTGSTGAQIDLTTQLANPNFPVVNGFIYSVLSDGSSGWFIGGTFSKVGNSPHMKSRLAVLDVAQDGMCVAAAVHLSGIVLLKIQVAEGRNAEVRGEVRWADKRRKIYGIRLLKTDLHWQDFVQYLKEDFDSLNLERAKKVS